MVMPYLTPGGVQCVTLMIWVIMIQNFDIYILVNEGDWCILWNTGAFNKTKQKN